MLVTGIRLVTVLVAAGLVAGDAIAAPVSGRIPVPRARPALKTDKAGKAAVKATTRQEAEREAGKGGTTRPAFTPSTSRFSATASIPSAGAFVPGAPWSATAPSSRPPMRPTAPLAMATTTATSPIDLTAVKQAVELVHKGRPDDATDVERTISDPLARKLVEWIILRSDDATLDFSRYAAFVAANPSWPSIVTLRRRAEVALWQQDIGPQGVIGFFANDPPHSAKGQFALARALLAVGNSSGAQAAIREAWRTDGFSGELEEQARATFNGLITPADDKARMDERLYVEDDDAALRAAQRLGPAEFAIAKARAAVVSKSANAKALLDAVPEADRRDPGYMFSRIQWLRRSDKVAEAAQWMVAASHDPAKLGDLDQWWIERRLVARKLLDLNEAKLAYEVADGGAPPPNENYRAEQQFTAGWIALRFLREPAVALTHFARIAEGVSNPITLARSFYWQGRAAEALGRGQDARAHYEAAARFPTAYYGQLARARLGLDDVTLRALPESPAERRNLELARAFEILYAIDERDLVASMAADLGDKATDAGALVTLAEIATRHNDARSTLLIGKTALSRGFPLEHFAFPDFGVPNYQQIGPAVERCVVYSIVRQESAFNPRAVSSARALGLMQVTPDAGRTIAKKFNVAFDQRRLLEDVTYNAQIGTAELGDVISGYRGSYILAFASYNAGRRRVQEWIEQYGDPRNPRVDPVDWIERIPFSETRNYVERVIENMQVYRARIENNPKLLIEADLRRGG